MTPADQIRELRALGYTDAEIDDIITAAELTEAQFDAVFGADVLDMGDWRLGE